MTFKNIIKKFLPLIFFSIFFISSCATNLSDSSVSLIRDKELYIPKEWNVDNKANSSLGGFDEKNEPASKRDENTIIIKGNTCFSGVEIIYI